MKIENNKLNFASYSTNLFIQFKRIKIEKRKKDKDFFHALFLSNLVQYLTATNFNRSGNKINNFSRGTIL